MGFNISIHTGFFLLIIITGVLSTVTDLRHKKIRNNHLIIIAVAAVILTITKGLSDKSLPMLQSSSAGCAIIIAWVFYKNDLWRGGDAKLFVLLSFLMPVTGYESKIFLPSIVLFVNSFIIGLISIGFLSLKDFFANPKLGIENISKILIRVEPCWLMATISCVTWIILPLFHACGLTKYGALPFLSTYMITVYLGSQIRILISHKAIAVIAFACGLLLRYKFSPGFFLWKNFLLYLSTIIMYGVFSIFLRDIAKFNERIPFSPFLFLGCLLSYTPFLWWIMALQHLGK